MEQIIQIIGLIVALCYIILGIDDLLWDIYYFVRNIRSSGSDRLHIEHLDAVPPKLLAVIIAAWHEENVIELVIENMISSIHYPESMYHVFVGVYPNDKPTMDIIKKLERQYANVHMVVNVRPGPTNKADNINNIIRYIKEFESSRQWRFSSITIHDSEDVVHPYELKLTNYLLDSYDVLQFPVIPLQKMPTLKNIFQSMTSGTYADEFAENHYRIMGAREALSAVVPSAGTGYVLSHAILETFDGEPLFPEDSLTEDYKLSLQLAQKGFNTHFVLEKVPRLMDNNTVRWDFVATRSFFPDTFQTAVRQKTRWIYGITMQSAKFSEIFKRNKMGVAGRYSLYKDLKPKVSNLMVLPGYLVFIYFIVSLLTTVPVMYPQGSLAYNLCVFLSFMMIFRQFMRAVAITNFYGFRSMAVACLLPPLMPIRLVWGNIINMVATFRAWKLFFVGTGAKQKKKKIAWSKTDHTFLQKQVLLRYYRKTGDVLLEKKYIDVSALSAALRQSKSEGSRIREVLLRDGLVSEEYLAEAVASVEHKIFVKNISAFSSKLRAHFEKNALESLMVYPLLQTETGFVFAAAESSDIGAIPKELGLAAENCHFVFTTKAGILKAIRSTRDIASPGYKLISEHLEMGRITWEQAVLALDKFYFAPDILAYMGLKSTGPTTTETAPPKCEEPSAEFEGVSWMVLKKSWFYHLTLALFEICAVYALFSGITDMANSKAYPFLWYGGLLCVFAAALSLVHIVSRFLAQRGLPGVRPEGERQLREWQRRDRHYIIAERAVVVVVLAISALIRIWVITELPIAPSSDYQTYYQIADLLSKGTLNSSGYSGYIAKFPHVIGYPFILSLLFRITGPSLAAGLYLNLAASLFSVFLTYRIARTLCGRLGGMIALLGAAFWPSQILYGTILASEPVFTCMLLLSIWLFIYFYRSPVRLENREGSLFLCCTLGVLLALTSAVSPLAEILLVAVVLCCIPFVVRFNKNERMLYGRLSRASCQGWFLSLVVLISFFICNQLLSAAISNTIAYKMPGGSVSFGYNLMVGVNIDAKGAWNQQDADFFSNEFTSTNSAEAAHKASLNVGLERIRSNPVGVANLAMEKFTSLWGNDDYAGTWTTLFLDQQNNLTRERQNIIDRFTQWNGYFYLFGIFFSAVFGLQLFKQKTASPAHVLILLFIGTVALHMVLESQNRYHYFILPVFMILSSMAIAGIYRGYARMNSPKPNEQIELE